MKTEIARRIVAEWLEEQALPPVVARDIPAIDLDRLNEILAIVGPRRAGKTFFMYQLIQGLLAGGKHAREDILFVDFEDYRLADFKAADVEHLFVAFNRLTGKLPAFVFFDEVQHLSGWSRVLRTLHNQRRYRLVISGSNSELLGREIATELRGRYQDVLMLPLSFAEALRFKGVAYTERSLLTAGRGKVQQVFDAYLEEGGFPEVLGKSTALEKQRTLQNYYRTIYYKDILERYNIKAKYVLEAMMRYCLDVYGDLFSISAFAQRLKTNGLPGSKRTVSNYLQYLREAFFLIVHDKFSYAPRKRLMNPKKVYLLDVGFGFLATDFSENKGKLLENVVAIELFRRQEETFYYKGRQECDFVIKRGSRLTLAMQVCWVLNERTQERELNGLVEAMTELGIKQGAILTYEQEATLKHKTHAIQVLPVWQWLLKTGAAAETTAGNACHPK